MAKYVIIKNPQNLILKHEVWYKGETDVQNARGYLERQTVCKAIKAFRSSAAAEGYIQYQTNVRQFREAE